MACLGALSGPNARVRMYGVASAQALALSSERITAEELCLRVRPVALPDGRARPVPSPDPRRRRRDR